MLSRLSNFAGPFSIFSKNKVIELSYGSMTLVNGSESHLLSTSNDYVIGSDDFTIESWFKIDNYVGYSGIFSTRDVDTTKGIGINVSPGSPTNLEFYNFETIYNLNEYPIEIDKWYHAAMTRTGGTTSYFLDGIKINQFSDTNIYQGATISVGQYYTNYYSYFFDGLISQTRLIIGTAIYTDDFIVSITASDINGTKFLINQGTNTFIDESSYHHDITNSNVGFTKILPTPITSSQSSISFNGSTDWLELPSSNDWALTFTYTIEFWSKAATNSNSGSIFTIVSQGDTDSGIDLYYQNGNLVHRNGNVIGPEPTPNVWTHVAIVSDSSTIRLYYNGIDQSVSANGGNLSNTGGIAIGRRSPSYNFQYFNGLLYGIRIVKGFALYNNNFNPYITLPPTLITGTVLLLSKFVNGNFLDSSYKRIITNYGLTYNSNLPTKPGSFRFGLNDVTERYISIPASNDFAFGTNDFTVEWFQYQTQVSPPDYSRLFQIGTYPEHSFAVSIESGALFLWLDKTYYGVLALSNYLNEWSHFAISRQSGTVSIWQDGSRIWTGTVGNSVTNNSDVFKIGSGSSQVWNGYISNFRLVTGNGNCVYDPSNLTITVPTTALTNVSGTKLLLLFGENNPIDSSIYNRQITNYGATWSSISPLF